MQKTTVIRGNEIESLLDSTPSSPGKHMVPWPNLPEGIKLPFNILEDTDITTNEAEVHEKEGDYWECLEGEVIFIVEGVLENPRLTKENEWKGSGIKNGKHVVLKKGDRLWIPPGVPHVHIKEKGTVRLMITKIR